MGVVGSSSSFFEYADRVVMMKDYRAMDKLERVRQICEEMPGRAIAQQPTVTISERSPKAMSFADIRNSKIKTDRSSIAFVYAQPGLVDLSALQQIESDD